MRTIDSPVENLTRVHGRGSLLTILEKETLLTRIKVLNNVCFITETKDWDLYRKPLRELGFPDVENKLINLHSTWSEYIKSGFNSFLRREYCFRYFTLLDIVLAYYHGTGDFLAWSYGLQAVLGFECFGITQFPDSEVLGAGVCTLRNPCYLLAKLKMPDAPDDPQLLPVITITGANKHDLFYYYRQYTLSPDSRISILLYPVVSEVKRSESFKVLNSLVGSVSYAIDPRTRERAKRLFHGAIFPIIQANKLDKSVDVSLELVDVGAGSGSLSSCMCQQVLDFGVASGFNPRLQLWFVDLEPTDPTRFFRKKGLGNAVDNLTYLGCDYRIWLSETEPLTQTRNIRIALMTKLFNNLSNFDIQRLSGEELATVRDKIAFSSNSAEYLPSFCLEPCGKGAESLITSNTRIALKAGRTFAQLSLSEYYRGLYYMTMMEKSAHISGESVFLPMRSFNPDSLITKDSRSVFSRLLEYCEFVVIEDADLRPNDLIVHMETFSLHSLAVQNLTKALGLTGNYAYVVWLKNMLLQPTFPGERIW